MLRDGPDVLRWAEPRFRPRERRTAVGAPVSKACAKKFPNAESELAPPCAGPFSHLNRPVCLLLLN